jgi:hypothetical protein
MEPRAARELVELMVMMELLVPLAYKGQRLGHCQLQCIIMELLTILEMQLLILAVITIELATH